MIVLLIKSMPFSSINNDRTTHLVPSTPPSPIPIIIRFPRGKRKWKRNKIEGCAPVLNGINLEHCFSAPRVAP